MIPRLARLAADIAIAPSTQFWAMAGIAALAIGGCTAGAYVQLARKRLLENTPTARLRSAAQGYVELQGEARLFDGEPIVAPLSGRPCAWFSFRVERRSRGIQTNGRRHSEWRVVERGISDGLFVLDDGTGRCAVDPEGAIVTASCRWRWHGRTRIPPRYTPAPVWWAWIGLAGLGQDYRYTEERIDAGDILYALGLFRTHGGAARRLEDDSGVAERLRDWKRDRTTLLQRFDANGDGDIDAAEWQHTRAAAIAEMAAERGADAARLAVDLLAAPDDGRPFLLAATSEQALRARHGRWFAALAVAAGAGALALSWALLARLG